VAVEKKVDRFAVDCAAGHVVAGAILPQGNGRDTIGRDALRVAVGVVASVDLIPEDEREHDHAEHAGGNDHSRAE
jgi:hypothetical protein